MQSDLSTQKWSDRSDFVRPIYKLPAIFAEQKVKIMISEILDIIANLGNLPNKESKPKDGKKDLMVFICYVVSAVCIIFIIPEFKEIRKLENSSFFISLIILISICLTFLSLLLSKKINFAQNLNFSTFITLIISIFLFFSFMMLLIINKYY